MRKGFVMMVFGLFGLAGLAALAFAVLVTARRVRVDDRDVAWLAGGELPADPAVADVYRRYLRRHRSHRTVGGWLGVLLAMTYGIAAQSGVNIGAGLGSPLGDVLFCGLAGVIAGALSAEVYRVAARPGPGVASLAPHVESRDHRIVLAGRILLLVAVAVDAGRALADGTAVALGAVLAGAVVVGMAEATRRAIADRRRPILSPAAAQVDARVRGYASTAVARLGLAGAALTADWALVGVAPSSSVPLVVYPLVTVGLLVLALVQLHRARPRPPRGFAALPVAPALAGAP